MRDAGKVSQLINTSAGALLHFMIAGASVYQCDHHGDERTMLDLLRNHRNEDDLKQLLLAMLRSGVPDATVHDAATKESP